MRGRSALLRVDLMFACQGSSGSGVRTAGDTAALEMVLLSVPPRAESSTNQIIRQAWRPLEVGQDGWERLRSVGAVAGPRRGRSGPPRPQDVTSAGESCKQHGYFAETARTEGSCVWSSRLKSVEKL